MSVKVRRRAGSAVASAKRRSSGGSPIELPDGMWDRISQKAYELWEERGRRAGRDLEDWFDAEVIVMEAIHEARE